MAKTIHKRIIIALDFNTLKETYHLVDKIDPTLYCLKVGKELFTRFGPVFVKELVDKQFNVFLDLKFHDIPNTVAGACKAAADLGVWMLDLHASGGSNMLLAAKEALSKYKEKAPLLIAVTVLTSLDEKGIYEIGWKEKLRNQILTLAKLAKNCGLDGIVCSACEASFMREHLGENMLLITPGIRLEPITQDDQLRVMTPKEAILSGSHYLVIGRPVTRAPDPVAVLNKIQLLLQ